MYNVTIMTPIQLNFFHMISIIVDKENEKHFTNYPLDLDVYTERNRETTRPDKTNKSNFLRNFRVYVVSWQSNLILPVHFLQLSSDGNLRPIFFMSFSEPSLDSTVTVPYLNRRTPSLGPFYSCLFSNNLNDNYSSSDKRELWKVLSTLPSINPFHPSLSQGVF